MILTIVTRFLRPDGSGGVVRAPRDDVQRQGTPHAQELVRGQVHLETHDVQLAYLRFEGGLVGLSPLHVQVLHLGGGGG